MHGGCEINRQRFLALYVLGYLYHVSSETRLSVKISGHEMNVMCIEGPER